MQTDRHTDWRTYWRHLLGPSGVVDDPAAMAPYLSEWRGFYQGQALLVARPSSIDQVIAVVRRCRSEGLAIIPQGGNTGLVGGGVPSDPSRHIVLSLEKMNRLRRVDPQDNTMTVEAGCILSEVQQAAERVERLFPLRMASQGRCQIGGAIATNSGGTGVIRYGSMRDLVLGIEAVLPDGSLFNDLKRLRKDNSGYDLKHLLIGSEGTLGIVTAAVLKLFPRPASQATVMAAFSSLEHVLDFFHRAGAAWGGDLTAFELMPRIALDLVCAHIPETQDPFSGQHHPWYALIEVSSHKAGDATEERSQKVIAEALEAAIIMDARVASTLRQADSLWRLRDSLPEAQTRAGGSIKHDLSVPISTIPAFIDQASQAIEAAFPGARPVAFGHIGDGNIHFNISQPKNTRTESEKKAFLDHRADINRLIHDLVHRYGGSVSAEHGVGLLKRFELARLGDPVGLDLMRRIKQVIDPENLMNPGKIL